MAKRKASKGYPKQKLNWSPSPNPQDLSQSPRDAPAALSLLLAIGSASVVLQPLRCCWSIEAGCWGDLFVLTSSFGLPCAGVSQFHTGRIWEQQPWPPCWAAALPRLTATASPLPAKWSEQVSVAPSSKSHMKGNYILVCFSVLCFLATFSCNSDRSVQTLAAQKLQ